MTGARFTELDGIGHVRECAPSFTLDSHIAFARAHRSPDRQALYDAEQAAWVAKMDAWHRSLPRPTAGGMEA
jgi:hypothetical protein